MDQQPDTSAFSTAFSAAIAQYRVPAVRHLAWMSRAPQLTGAPVSFDLAEHLPEDLEQRLRAWDTAPETGPALLTATPAPRLGKYFEHLYHCLLKDVLGWDILLSNQPVRSNGITLGELDFIVRNPVDQTIEHHEIAVKFYLGYTPVDAGSTRTGPLWYGPDARDRLDLKSERLITRQSRLTEKPETRDLLGKLNIPVPVQTRIFMPGYLFYPASQPLPSPPGVPPNHLRGEWLGIDDLDRLNHSGALPDTLRGQWVPLVKPHWLGTWRQKAPPDGRAAEQALAMVRATGKPRLFAVLEQDAEQVLWRERNRVFVVPGTWPGAQA